MIYTYTFFIFAGKPCPTTPTSDLSTTITSRSVWFSLPDTPLANSMHIDDNLDIVVATDPRGDIVPDVSELDITDRLGFPDNQPENTIADAHVHPQPWEKTQRSPVRSSQVPRVLGMTLWIPSAIPTPRRRSVKRSPNVLGKLRGVASYTPRPWHALPLCLRTASNSCL